MVRSVAVVSLHARPAQRLVVSGAVGDHQAGECFEFPECSMYHCVQMHLGIVRGLLSRRAVAVPSPKESALLIPGAGGGEYKKESN